MNINFNLDIEGAIAAALSPEKLNPILEKHITSAITGAIDDATGYRSPFRNGLTEQLTAALPHGLGVDDVGKFQHQLNAALRSVVSEANNASIQAALQKAVETVMPDVPPVIKLSSLMEDMRDYLHKEAHEPFYAFMDKTDHGTTHIYFDEDDRPGSSSRYIDREEMKHRADYRLSVSKDGDVYSLKLDGQQLTPSSRPNVISKVEGLLMAMYTGRTKLEIDMDDDDLESLSAEQEP